MGVAMARGLPPGGVRVALWSPRSILAVSTGVYRSPRLTQIWTGGGAVAGVPRGTCTGHWHTSKRALVSGGTARGGGGEDQAYAYAMAWSHHPGRVPPSGAGRRSCTLPSIT